MELQCECGKFRAELTDFPNQMPGRLKCYCDDCQTYLHYLKRADLLDANAGTEIIPAYPANVRIVSGQEHVKCTRIIAQGMYRYSTSCCNTPIANTEPGRPWFGIHRRMFTVKNPNELDQRLGPVRASIFGKYAKDNPPPGTPEKFNFKGFKIVMPFILKGIVFGKAKPSPFFQADGTSVAPPHVLSAEERNSARQAARL